MWDDIYKTGPKIQYYNEVLKDLPRTKNRALSHGLYMLLHIDTT
jgi:hypothetical protein